MIKIVIVFVGQNYEAILSYFNDRHTNLNTWTNIRVKYFTIVILKIFSKAVLCASIKYLLNNVRFIYLEIHKFSIP